MTIKAFKTSIEKRKKERKRKKCMALCYTIRNKRKFKRQKSEQNKWNMLCVDLETLREIRIEWIHTNDYMHKLNNVGKRKAVKRNNRKTRSDGSIFFLFICISCCVRCVYTVYTHSISMPGVTMTTILKQAIHVMLYI